MRNQRFGVGCWVLVVVATLSLSGPGVYAQGDSVRRTSDPNAFRLFMAPTSETLPADHGTIQMAEIVVPTVNYGIIDELIVRGGFTPFTISSHVLYYGLAGLQIFDYNGFSGVGGIAFTNATGTERAWESALYGFGVVGYTANNFGIYGGIGGGYSGRRESNTAIAMLGGEVSISAHNKLISENWIISESETNAFAIGLRSYGSLLSVDIGVIGVTESHSLKFTTVVPWVALSYHFDVSEE